MDSRFLEVGYDGVAQGYGELGASSVIPAKAGIQDFPANAAVFGNGLWIPAFAGMTGAGGLSGW